MNQVLINHILLSLTFCVLFLQVHTTMATLTQEEFNLSVTSNGYPVPNDEVYHYFAENTGNYSRNEAAMFVAQLIHESGGFRYTEQQDCMVKGSCEGSYNDGRGLANRSYHGRGYIQLTWPANYEQASLALNMSRRLLLEQPDLVASDHSLAMRVSSWYWNARVRPLLARGGEDMFGLTTKAINPGECTRVKGHEYFIRRLARRRYQIYEKVANALKISDKAKENGCYN